MLNTAEAFGGVTSAEIMVSAGDVVYFPVIRSALVDDRTGACGYQDGSTAAANFTYGGSLGGRLMAGRDLSPDDIRLVAAELGKNSPVDVALSWLRATVADAWEEAWSFVDPASRLLASGTWLWAARHDCGLEAPAIGAMALSWTFLHDLGGQLWTAFSMANGDSAEAMLEPFPPLDQWRHYVSSEHVTSDQQLVRFLPAFNLHPQRREVTTVPFLMRYGPDGWKVRAPLAEMVIETGWPPPELAPYL